MTKIIKNNKAKTVKSMSTQLRPHTKYAGSGDSLRFCWC